MENHLKSFIYKEIDRFQICVPAIHAQLYLQYYIEYYNRLFIDFHNFLIYYLQFDIEIHSKSRFLH